MEPKTFLLDIDQDLTPDQQSRATIQTLESEGWRHVETVRVWERWQMVFRKAGV